MLYASYPVVQVHPHEISEICPASQVGSIVTVGALSLVDSFSFGPRILGGFLGQLLCLAAILGFRWGREAAMKTWGCNQETC